MPESQARSRGLPALLALGAISLAGSHYVNAGAAQDAAAAHNAATEPMPRPRRARRRQSGHACRRHHSQYAEYVLRHLPQQQTENGGAAARRLGCHPRRRSRTAVGEGRDEAAHRRDAAAGPAAAGFDDFSRGRGRAGTGARRCGGGPPASRPRSGSPIESERVHERRPRSARCGGRCACAAAIGRGRSGRVRQRRQRAVGVASTAGGLPVGRANHQPQGGGRSDAAARDRQLQDLEGARARRPRRRRPALRLSRRGADPLLLSRRRRVFDQSPVATPGVRLHRRYGRAASARFPSRRRAAETILGRRRGKGDDDAGELRREHSGRSRVGGVHAHRRRASRDAHAGEGGPSRGRRLFRRAIVGARRHSAAATNWLRTDDQRVLPR